jgi:hypothetical protein
MNLYKNKELFVELITQTNLFDEELVLNNKDRDQLIKEIKNPRKPNKNLKNMFKNL